MGYLVSRGSGGNISYSGTNYVNPTHGTHKLCLRTGTGTNDIVKYGFTTNTSASKYCGMRMRIEGNVAYLGCYQSGSNTYNTSQSTSRRSTSIYNYSTSSNSSSTISTSATRSTISNYMSTSSYQYAVTGAATYTQTTQQKTNTYNSSKQVT